MSMLPKPTGRATGSRLPKPPIVPKKRHRSASPESQSRKRVLQDHNTTINPHSLHRATSASKTGSSITTRRPISKPSTSATEGSVKKKRPAWDVKGRLQDMEEHMQLKEKERDLLLQEMKNYNGRIEQLESTNQQLSGAVQEKNHENTEHSARIDALQEDIRKQQRDWDDTKRQYERNAEDMSSRLSSLQRQNATLDSDLIASREECTSLKTTIAKLTSAQAGLQAELEATKLLLINANRTIEQRDTEITGHKDTISQQEAELDRRHAKNVAYESERRKLHNTIQELKGNIRVFCRVRPLLPDEDAAVGQCRMNLSDPDKKMVELDKMSEFGVTERAEKHQFAFDHVFTPESSQAAVYDEISQLVQSSLDGYNVCIFAYGQTGSGKTYTMEGPGGGSDPITEGMIPRAVTQVFENARELANKGWTYSFEASFIEIYNETLRDLLGDGKDAAKIEIHQAGHDVKVTNLNCVAVMQEGEVHRLLEKARINRAVAETKCNERSSRSHAIFRLKVVSSNSITSEHAEGYLNLVDLAGSERLKDSGSEGQRLKETQAINKSLSNLGIVIMALGNKDAHIPYRNSKLTYLLQNSLGGNSKTLMFVNVSPREDTYSETLSSLRFAAQVNRCNIGTAQKKVRIA